MVSRGLSDLNETTNSIVEGEQGQAVVEYILMIAFIVMIYVMVANMMSRSGLDRRLYAALTGPFAATYQYGYSKVKGFDQGGPEFHPRAVGGNNFRIFTNPKKIGG